MNIEEIEKSLPNGFHDSTLHKIVVDYRNREAILYLEIDVNDYDEKTKEGTFRNVKLITEGLNYITIEPPDPDYSYNKIQRLWISDSGPLKSLNSKSIKIQKIPISKNQYAFEHYFFIADLNCFIFISGLNARFEIDE